MAQKTDNSKQEEVRMLKSEMEKLNRIIKVQEDGRSLLELELQNDRRTVQNKTKVTLKNHAKQGLFRS